MIDIDALQNFTNTSLTDKEKKLLEVLLNPQNRMKSITDICKIAKCSRPVYYDAFSKSEFVEIYNRRSADLIKQSVAPIINTFIREALRGSFQHGKIILEMAGLYSEKLGITTKANNPFEGLTTEELKKLIQDE